MTWGKPGMESNQSWTTTRKRERLGKSRIFSCGRSAGANPSCCCSIWALQLIKAHVVSMPFLLCGDGRKHWGCYTNSNLSSVQYNTVSWALCHVWTDYTLHLSRGVPQVTTQRGCCYCRITLLRAEGKVTCSAAEDGSGSELNTREKDWHKALGKETNIWRETYPSCLYSKILNLVVDCGRHFFKLI